MRISDHPRRGMYINISISSLGCTMSGVVSDYILIFLLHLKCSARKVVYWVAYVVRDNDCVRSGACAAPGLVKIWKGMTQGQSISIPYHAFAPRVSSLVFNSLHRPILVDFPSCPPPSPSNAHTLRTMRTASP